MAQRKSVWCDNGTYIGPRMSMMASIAYLFTAVIVGATRHGRGPSLPRRSPGKHRACDL